ncbi:hypothetical protein Tco_1457979 [Tanacetum coccineum]
MMVTGERRYLDCVCAHESIAEGIEESHNYDSMSNVMLSAVGVVDVSMYSDNVVSCWNLRGGVMMGGKLDLGLIGGLYGEEEGEGWGIGGIVVRTLVCRYEQWWGVSMCQYTVRDLVDDSHCEEHPIKEKGKRVAPPSSSSSSSSSNENEEPSFLEFYEELYDNEDLTDAQKEKRGMLNA